MLRSQQAERRDTPPTVESLQPERDRSCAQPRGRGDGRLDDVVGGGGQVDALDDVRGAR